MPLTLAELGSLGEPSRAEIEKLASLRPSTRSLEVNQAENRLLEAQRDFKRVSEHQRRCSGYLNSVRKPEQHGFSTNCALETSAVKAASGNLKRAQARVKELRTEMTEQRKASYEVDLRRYERASPITYARSPSGVFLPTRKTSPAQVERLRQPAPRAPQPPGRNRFLIALGGIAAAGLAAFLLKR